MKIMVMTDMEGVAGILNHDDWVTPHGRFYAKGQRFLTEEVNAAVDGLLEGGAEEVIVIDGHGYGGIDPELLDERVKLIRGTGEKVWPWWLDQTFEGLAFVGQHAKAGTPYSHITHTQGFNYVDLTINDVSIGEYGQLALCAMELKIPTILACGENAFVKEAEKLTPGVVTVAVKWGLLPDGLDQLDTEKYGRAKLSAIHLSPKRVRCLIREAAIEAAKKLSENPSSFRYPTMAAPYVRTAKFRKNGDVPAHNSRDIHPDSIITLMNMPYTPSSIL